MAKHVRWVWVSQGFRPCLSRTTANGAVLIQNKLKPTGLGCTICAQAVVNVLQDRIGLGFLGRGYVIFGVAALRTPRCWPWASHGTASSSCAAQVLAAGTG